VIEPLGIAGRNGNDWWECEPSHAGDVLKAAPEESRQATERGSTEMVISSRDRQTLRHLAGRYSEIARLDVQKERMERYYRTNARENVRPVVLIDEVPWGEIRDSALTNTCATELGWIEWPLRCALYQWEHFQVDQVVPPVFRVGKRARWLSGIGIEVRERQIKGDTGAYISSHAYCDQLSTEDDLAKLHPPEVVYDPAATEAAFGVAEEVFAGLMDVEIVGWGGLHFNIWDDVARYRGVENLLMDLSERPAFMHETARRFMEIGRAQFKQLEEQGLLDFPFGIGAGFRKYHLIAEYFPGKPVT
jgi:hypothetical protein